MSIKLKGSSDGSVSFDAPADTSPSGSDITLTLPTSAGSANQFLKNSGIAGELEHSSMVETSTGVGIGTSSPQRDLHIHNADSSTNTYLQLTSATTGTGSTDGFQLFAYGSGSSSNAAIVQRENAALEIWTNNTEQARLDASGRLLVGTSSTIQSDAGNKLQIAADGAAGIVLGRNDQSISNGNTMGSIGWWGNDTGSYQECAQIRCDAAGSHANNDKPSQLVFSTCADNAGSVTERMKITHKGTINQTTNPSDSDRYNNSSQNIFHTDLTNNVNMLLENSSASPYGMLIDFSDASPDNNTNYFFEGHDSSTIRVKIFSDGDIDNHDNSYGGTSDQKLKQDIVDAGSQWDDLKDLRVRKFKFKEDVATYGDEAKTLIGLVAQEAETVCPGLVKDNPDQDDDGNDLGTVTKSVRYSVLYMKAIKALQEAQTRIETLETQNTAQQAQIDDLLARVTALEAA